ncbi:hypothetical protein niasHS_004478 [Heterodera schachtii]|uniref:MATH domain-containing protein n=1 Tax=Heterodera schachtii TaxID=97005 RepID=A0ABD2JJ87_HETSC
MTVVRGKFGFESILEVLETAKGIDRTVLSKCYRSHSAIVKGLDVGVYSPAAERKHMVSEIERRRWPNVKVSTVDSIQRQEAELVLVITTRSAAGRSTEADTGKEFWADCARTTVALSRPKFGLVIIGDLSLIWHKGTVWRRFIDETLKMTVAVTPEYLNLISTPFPARVVFRPFTAQANVFPPISSGHAQPPAFSHGMMIIDTSVRPPPINMIAAHTMPMPSNHPGPSTRMAPYPPQHLPRTSYAEAAQQAPSNTNSNRRIDVKCYRCGKIGHFSKRFSTDVLTREERFGVFQHYFDLKLSDAPGLFPLKFPTQQRYKYEDTIEMEIEKVSEFAGEDVRSYRFSDAVDIGGFSWKILAQIKRKNVNNEKWLGFFLECDASKEDGNWSRESSATLRIVSQKNGTDDLIGEFNARFNKKSKGWGFSNFICFEELMDPSRGFYNKDEDKVKLAIDVIVEEPKTDKFFSDPNKSNGTFLLEIEKISEFERY